jgi:hypothetical protein
MEPELLILLNILKRSRRIQRLKLNFKQKNGEEFVGVLFHRATTMLVLQRYQQNIVRL